MNGDAKNTRFRLKTPIKKKTCRKPLHLPIGNHLFILVGLRVANIKCTNDFNGYRFI